MTTEPATAGYDTDDRDPSGPVLVRPPAAGRRAPTQARSRRRVEAILDAASRLVLTVGVEDLTTRAIADGAGVPVASLYQYFADKEDVVLALAERDMAEMDDQLASDLAALEQPTVDTVVRTALGAFVAVYDRRPAFVEIYLRGRGNASVARFGREHNRRVAGLLREYAVGSGVARDDLTDTATTLAVEIGDRVFQLAYEASDAGDQELVEEGTRMLVAYLERWAR